MEREAQGVDRRLQEFGGDVFVQFGQRRVAGGNPPVPIECESRVGFLPIEYQIDCGARRRQRGIVERPFGKNRREACRDQKHIALADRHVELFGKKKHHVAARLRTPGFQKTQMPRRNSGVRRQIKLAQSAAVGAIGAKGRRPAGGD